MGLKESVPFALNPGVLVIGLSAPEGFPADHVVEVLGRRSDGTLLGNAQVGAVLQPGLPGELVACPVLSLSGVVFPGEGDYEFLVKVDGKDSGVVTFFVRAGGLKS